MGVSYRVPGTWTASRKWLIAVGFLRGNSAPRATRMSRAVIGSIENGGCARPYGDDEACVTKAPQAAVLPVDWNSPLDERSVVFKPEARVPTAT